MSSTVTHVQGATGTVHSTQNDVVTGDRSGVVFAHCGVKLTHTWAPTTADVTCQRCTRTLATIAEATAQRGYDGTGSDVTAPHATVAREDWRSDYAPTPADRPVFRADGARWNYATGDWDAPFTGDPGDRVEITSGRLTGARGTVTRYADGDARTVILDSDSSVAVVPLCDLIAAPADVASTFRAAPGSARALAIRASLAADPVDVSTVTVSPSRQAALAEVYASLPELGHMLDDTARETQRAYNALAAETVDQWNAIRAAGVAIIVQDSDPYANAGELIADIEDNSTLRVWDTAQTGSHPYLSDALNNMFRAVHDLFGHAATGRAFDRHGEEAAYIAHASMFSVTARRALASETRGQNAQVVALGDFSGPQRVALLPAEWCTVDALRPTADELPGTLDQAARNHASHGLQQR